MKLPTLPIKCLVLGGMVKRQYKIVYTNKLIIFNTVEYIQKYSLYSKNILKKYSDIHLFIIQT